MRLEHDRREQLDPVGHQLAMTRLAQLAAVVVDREPRRPLARHQGGLLVGRARADRYQRAGDPTSDELVLPRRLRPLMTLDLALTALTASAP
jgi:hypothetical protein